MASSPTVAVIGAGITGLRAADLLTREGADVVVYEASDRPGGQIRTVEVAGTRVDVGAEAMHLGAPGMADLIDSLGLRDDMVTARPGSSWLVTPRGLRRLPKGVGPAGPTQLRPVLTSRVMTVPGLVRAGLEPLRTRMSRPLSLEKGQDVSVGEFVRNRFGRQVVERFVDPLLGSLHAGDVSTLSLRATTPSLVPAATQRRSLVTGRKKPTGGPARPGNSSTMSFVSWREGLTRVVDGLVGRVDVRLSTPVDRIECLDDGRYRLHLGGENPTTAEVDAVILAVANTVAAPLLSDLAPAASTALAATPRATVATVLAAYPRHVVEALPALRGTGMLVPSSTGSFLKAATFLSRKWPHLDVGEWIFLRLSAGRLGDDRMSRLDDDALMAQIRADLRDFIGLDVAPRHVHIERWHETMPQLTVGHTDRIAAARAALPPGLFIAGSSYDGVGIAACITSAARAAQHAAAHLGLTAPTTSGERA